jgi:hypothetical protein
LKTKLSAATAVFEGDEPEAYPESIFSCFLTTKTGNVLPYRLKVNEFHLVIVSSSGSVKADYHLADIIISGDEKLPRKTVIDTPAES